METIQVFIREILEKNTYIPKVACSYNMLLEIYRLYLINNIPVDKFYWEVMYLYYSFKFDK